jgi:hypothetical protein
MDSNEMARDGLRIAVEDRKVKAGLCISVSLILMVAAGCTTTVEHMLSEKVFVPPDTWARTTLDVCHPKSPYVEHLGLNSDKYAFSIYDGLKILRISLLSSGEYYVFEIQTDGDIELAKRFYGNSVQFHVSILFTDMQVFTTVTMNEAVLVSGPDGKIEIKLDEARKPVSVRRASNYSVIARLKLTIDRDRMRIHLPKDKLPRENSDWWPDECASFRYRVRTRLALEALKPIPTNLPDVVCLPSVYELIYHYPGESLLLPTDLWDITYVWEASEETRDNSNATVPAGE